MAYLNVDWKLRLPICLLSTLFSKFDHVVAHLLVRKFCSTAYDDLCQFRKRFCSQCCAGENIQ